MNTTTIPRPEHPQPQFERAEWRNLNGEWSFAFDHGNSGVERELFRSRGFDRKITVPFCLESALSGVGHTDFIERLWYHRELAIPAGWQERVLLHFGGVDYQCDAFLDGQLVGRHAGGQAAFAFDITRFVKPGGTHELVVFVRDNVRGYVQPSGKQSSKLASHGCHYTRVTGIWQTVWLEAVPTVALREVQIIPDLDGGRFVLIPRFDGPPVPLTVTAHTGETATGLGPVVLPLQGPRAWSPRDPFLYQLEFTAGADLVRSYAGLRKIHCDGNRLLLNNEPIYLRLVLDQGYYPDGIWTAPSDAALKRDIELALAAGFNGARLHQKVFEPRFHYWADRLGYLTWGESACWGCNAASIEGRDNFLREWREIIVRDRNHPSIIAWTPWNEAWWIQNEEQFVRTLNESYELAKSLDPTRPVHTASGGAHCRTDIWSVHSYGMDLAKDLAARQDGNLERAQKTLAESVPYAGQPYVVAEFGGIKVQGDGWGYGDAAKSLEEFYQRLDAQVKTIRAQADVTGFCYTQLTDVEQEQNGIYHYDRTAKFDANRISELFSQ
jgi:beta-galactosidase/beta-glucuronidase